MRTITIDLPDGAASQFDRLMARRGYESASDLMIDVLRLVEPEPLTQDKLESMLLEGLEGEAKEFTDADWDMIDCEVERRIATSGHSVR